MKDVFCLREEAAEALQPGISSFSESVPAYGAHLRGGGRSIALIGLMGSGKSTVGRLLAARLGLPFTDLDAVVAEEAGLPIPEIFRIEGERGFRARERNALARLGSGPPIVLATGGGAVLEPANRAVLKERFTTVWLRIPPAAAAGRALAEGADKRPLLAGEAFPEAKLAELEAARRPLYEEAADLVVDAESGGPEAVAARIHDEIR